MQMLFRIVYASKAAGTHHKLALDALRGLAVRDADHWQRLFLKHVDIYLEGAKAPDNEFRDFKNHVLHVGEDYWGGAPQKAKAWYDKFVRALTDRQFEEAVYCAGVLSHYYVDPQHPFHTGQSEAENNMHRAVEWSISRSYNDLRQRGLRQHPGRAVETGEGPGWIEDMVRRGAERAHRYYQPLLSGYNLDVGVVDPELGLGETCRNFLAELVVLAATGFARILDRGIVQADVSPPVVNLTLDTLLAGLGLPLNLILRRLEDAADRRAVEDAYDELRATGRVDRCLAADERAVRDLHRQEVVEGRTGDWAVPRTVPAKTERPAEPVSQFVEMAMQPAAPGLSVKMPPVPMLVPTAPAKEEAVAAQPRYFLAASNDVEAAPSIGSKTAAQLKQAGIVTVGDLLAADPHDLSHRLDTSWIGDAVIREWQDQARLVCDVAGLRGRDAQLLVGAGIRTRAALNRMTAGEIRALLKLFCETKDGRRLRACEHVPDLETVERWLTAAKAAPRNSVAA